VAWSAQDRVGNYRLLAKVGLGRSCEVWDALDVQTSERRAIKVLMDSKLADRDQIALLKQEFAVGRGLEHPQVIRIYDYQNLRGVVYIVMELFPAQNVKQMFLDVGTEGLAYFVPKIAEQAAASLGYLHSQGWIHRDVKPDNFLMNKQGVVKLIDFALAEKKQGGLAKMFGGKGKIQGTRSYMSPEQIRGKGVDERSDVYSLGCMLHELIAGKPPFTGANTEELLNKHLKIPPPPLEAAGKDVTADFAELVRKMLAKSPEGRPQNMPDLQRTLRAIHVFNRIPTAPVTQK
jgi:serine/threonine protein kinase